MELTKEQLDTVEHIANALLTVVKHNDTIPAQDTTVASLLKLLQVSINNANIEPEKPKVVVTDDDYKRIINLLQKKTMRKLHISSYLDMSYLKVSKAIEHLLSSGVIKKEVDGLTFRYTCVNQNSTSDLLDEKIMELLNKRSYTKAQISRELCIDIADIVSCVDKLYSKNKLYRLYHHDADYYSAKINQSVKLYHHDASYYPDYEVLKKYVIHVLQNNTLGFDELTRGLTSEKGDLVIALTELIKAKKVRTVKCNEMLKYRLYDQNSYISKLESEIITLVDCIDWTPRKEIFDTLCERYTNAEITTMLALLVTNNTLWENAGKYRYANKNFFSL